MLSCSTGFAVPSILTSDAKSVTAMLVVGVVTTSILLVRSLVAHVFVIAPAKALTGTRDMSTVTVKSASLETTSCIYR